MEVCGVHLSGRTDGKIIRRELEIMITRNTYPDGRTEIFCDTPDAVSLILKIAEQVENIMDLVGATMIRTM